LVTHTDYDQLDYKYHFSFCTGILPDHGQYVRLKHVVVHKNEPVKFVWAVFAGE